MDADQPPSAAFKRSHNGKPTHKYVGGPVVLNARMLRMIDLMVNGHPDDPSHTPYGLYDAAVAVGYQRRAARALAQAPKFLEAYWNAYAGKSNASEVPTLEQVQKEIAVRGNRPLKAHGTNCANADSSRAPQSASPGYVIRLAAKSPSPDTA